MRTFVLAIAVLFVVWLGLDALLAGEQGDARVRARVREYTDPTVGDLRRDLVVRELSSADPAVATRVVREALLSDARRAAAADLAARLRLGGVFDLAKRWADGPAAPQILRVAVAAPEPEAAAWLAERWRTCEPGSERFLAVDAALREGRTSPFLVERLAPALDDPVRAEAALAVLREQMGVDDPCPAVLRARWPAAWERYRFEAEVFPRVGEDLLAGPGWRLGNARRVGRNLRLPRSAIDLSVLPLATQTEAGTLHIRIAPGPGPGAFVTLRTAGAAQELRLASDGTSWFLVEGPPREGARVEAPCRAAAWADIEVRISDPALRDRAGVRDLRVFIDGAEMRPSGGFWRLASPPESLAIGASRGVAGDGGAAAAGADVTTCVGGVEWRRAR